MRGNKHLNLRFNLELPSYHPHPLSPHPGHEGPPSAVPRCTQDSLPARHPCTGCSLYMEFSSPIISWLTHLYQIFAQLSPSSWVYYFTICLKLVAWTFPSSSCCWSPFSFFPYIYQFPACYKLYYFLGLLFIVGSPCFLSTPLPVCRVLCCVKDSEWYKQALHIL